MAYRNDILQFVAFCDTEGVTLFTAGPAQVRSWVVCLVESANSKRTVNRKISSLRSFYQFHIRNGTLSISPMVKTSLLKTSRPLPVFVPASAMERIRYHAGSDTGDSDFSLIRNALVVDMFYFTGIRLSELIALRHSDVDLTGRMLKVLGKRNKERMIPLLPELTESMERYMLLKGQLFCGLSNDYFFILDNGKPLYPTWVYRLVRKVLGEVTSMSKRSPHVLRHTFATLLLNNGAELVAIKDLLGHASLAATQVYTHNSFGKIKRVYNNAHPRA